MRRSQKIALTLDIATQSPGCGAAIFIAAVLIRDPAYPSKSAAKILYLQRSVVDDAALRTG